MDTGPRLKIGESPKPVLWHVLSMFACLVVMPLLALLVQGQDGNPRVFVSIGLALVTLSLARWHYAHGGPPLVGGGPSSREGQSAKG